jgi:hypothetical protein
MRRSRDEDDRRPSRRGRDYDEAPTGRGTRASTGKKAGGGTLIKMSDELNKSLVTPKFRMSYCHLLEP